MYRTNYLSDLRNTNLSIKITQTGIISCDTCRTETTTSYVLYDEEGRVMNFDRLAILSWAMDQACVAALLLELELTLSSIGSAKIKNSIRPNNYQAITKWYIPKQNSPIIGVSTSI